MSITDWSLGNLSIRFDQLNERFFTAMRIAAFFMLLSSYTPTHAQCTSCTATTTTNTAVTITSGQTKCITTVGTYNQAISITNGTVCFGPGVNWSSATINMSGTCTIISYGTSSKSLSLGSGNNFYNYGTYTGGITTNGGTIVNYSGGTFTPSSMTINSGGGSFTNNVGGTATFGTLSIATGYTFNNYGKITIGSITVNSTGTIVLTGTSQTITGTIMNNGTFTYDGPGTLNGSTTQNSGGVMNLSGGVTITGAFSNNGTVNLSGSLTVSGAYSANSGASIKSADGSACNTLNLASAYSGGGTFNGNSYGLVVSPAPAAGNLTGGASGPVAAPTASPTTLTFTYNSAASLKLNYTAASPAPAGYLILRYIGTAAPTDNPVAYTSYTAGDVIGSCTVAGVSTTNTFTDVIPSSSNCGKTVYYRIFSYNGSGSCMQYRTTSPLTGSKALPTAPTLSKTSTNATCFGASNGTINLTVTGTTAPYTFAWSDGTTTEDNTDLAAGTYTVTVTDYNGCTVSNATAITQPATSSLTTAVVNGGTCGGTKGTVDLTVSGGATPYTYAWSNGSTAQDISNVSIGTYTVTITDANGCKANTSGSVAVSLAVSASMTSTNVTCYGGSNGATVLTASSGTSPYTYTWSNGATTKDLSGIAAGTYTVTVEDSKNCTVSVSKAITQATAVVATFVVANPTCDGAVNGTITTTVSGGSGTYTYLWNDGVTTKSRTALASGTYIVTVTDGNGCTDIETATLVDPNPTEYSINATFNSSAINAGNWLLFTSAIKPTGVGSSAVTIRFYNQTISGSGATISVPDAVVIFDPSVTVATTSFDGTKWISAYPTTLGAGNYFMSAMGFQSPGIPGSLGPVTWKGSYQMSRSGVTLAWQWGAAAYSYLGPTYNDIKIKPCDNATQSAYVNSDKAGTPEAFKGNLLSGGTGTGGTNYTGTLTTASAAITPCVAPICGMVTNLANTDVSCNGGSTGAVALSMVGGVAPYTFAWSNGATTQNLTGKTAGIYTVLVTDANGCTVADVDTINEPAVITASVVGTNVNCYGSATGSATLTVSGGTSPYTYAWTGGATTQNLTGITTGTYTVTITDAKSCIKTASVTITQPAAALAGSIVGTNINCFGASTGAATLTVTGGTSPYTYLWTGGATTQNITGKVAGTYTVTITDNKSCSTTASVTLTQPTAALTASLGGTNVNCYGSATGAVSNIVSGGTSPYTYAWTGGATTQSISGKAAGTYAVTVTDSRSCTTTSSVTITQPTAALTATTGGVNVSCNGGANGTVTTTPAGGTSPYTYAWSNSATTQNISALTTGTYTCTITDAKSCTVIVSKTVTQPNAITIGSSAVATTCGWCLNGSINLTVTGGTSGYTYAWSNGSTSQNLSGLVSNTYTVTVTDANGCTATKAISVNPPLAASIAGGSACTNNNGLATASGIGGTSPYTFLWSNGATTATISNLNSGTYSVTVKDANNVTATNSVVITNLNMNVTLSPNNSTICAGSSVQLTATGGTTYNWSPATGLDDPTSATPLASPTSQTTYTMVASTPTGNLVTNGDFALGNQGFTSAYGYVSRTTPNGLYPEGFYAVDSSAVTYHSAFTGIGHTGDKFMIINGAIYVGQAVWEQTVSTSTNTTYSFSTWITSVNAANPANLRFSINGVVLGPTIIAPSSTGSWIKYTAVWSSGSNTSAVISILNDNTVAGGNDFGLDDISFSTTCSSSSNSIVVKVNPTPTATITPTNINCFGNSTGAATLAVSGGTPNYSYSWSNGATTQSLTSKPAGTYAVTVTDNKSCTATATTTLTEPSAALAVTVAGTNILCSGSATGAATATVTGGTAPYTYAWSGGGSTATITGKVAGTYTVSITDAKGCTTSSAVTLTQPSVLSASIVGTNITCNGGTNGATALTVSGGVGPYTYLWTGGIATQNLTLKTAGTYTVTVTDANACTTTATVALTQPAAVTGTIVASNVACFGNSTGAATLTAAGGTSPYTYLWTGGTTSVSISGKAAGIYTVTITDSKLCTGTASVTITQPAAALSASTVGTNILCNGASTGSASLTVSGGTSPYTYLWTGGTTTQNLTGKAAGTYSVTVTDANACSTTSSVTLTQPTTITATVAGTNPTCNGASNGAATLTVSGGVAPYTYLWTGGATTQNLTGKAAGTYSVTVTDANACTKVASVTLTQPAAIVATITATNINCNGGTTGAATLAVTGGTAPYTYLWTGGSTNQNLSNLAAGTYAVTVTDANLCTGTASVTLTQPSAVSGTIVGTNVNCFGGTTGAATLTATGGTSPYTYLWTGGATTQNLTAKAAGTYSVTITDNKLCTSTTSVTITQPASALSASIAGTNLTCNANASGAADLTVTGGTSPYTYLWTGGATTQDVTGKAAGTYNVTVTDNKACTTTSTVTLTQPAAVTGTIVGTNVTCNGAADGTANLTPAGGTSPYTYLWTGGATSQDIDSKGPGTYTVTIKDANLCTGTASVTITQPAVLTASATNTNNGCNGGAAATATFTVAGGNTPYTYAWSNGSTTQNLTGLAAGTYTVTVTDAKACTATTSITVTNANAIVLTTTSTDVTCNGGTNGAITLTKTGPSGVYVYTWSNGSLTQNQSNLAAGTYTVTATIVLSSCTATATVIIAQPTAITTTMASTNPTCNGGSNGSASVTAGGGVAPYTYLWTGGSTTASITAKAAGTYTVTITDANNCTKTSSVTLIQPVAVTGTTVATNVSCNNGTNGAANLTAAGGTAPYTYLWTGGAITEDISGKAAGTYSVTITDANSCTGTASVTITQPTALSVTTSTTSINCYGQSTGTATATVSGGTPGYLYAWAGGGSGASIAGKPAGVYTVGITDLNGCSVTANANITQAAPLTASVTGTNPTCNGASNGAATVTVSGGTAPYIYLWSSGGTTASISGKAAGTYTVTVTSTGGCTTTASVTLTQPAAVTGSIAATNVKCNGASTGAATLTAAGGTSPYTYLWTSGATTASISSKAAGTYTVTITDANSCTGTSSVTITQSAAVTGTITATNVTCNGLSNGAATVAVAGGTAPYTYAWTGGATSSAITGKAAGTYAVTITDANSCTGTSSVTVTQPAVLAITATVTNKSKTNVNDGSITTITTGGTTTYTYAWSPTANTQNISSLAIGNYTVTVTDSKGCTATTTGTVGNPTGPCKCIATGVWSNAATWSGNCSGGGGKYAGYLDDITIQGYKVTVDSAHTVKSLILRESTSDTTKLIFTGTNSLNIIDSFYLNTIAAGKDIRVDIDGSAKLNVNGNFNINHSYGSNINVYLNANNGTSAKLKVAGNLNMTLNTGGKNILFQASSTNDSIVVLGDLNLTNNNGTSTNTNKVILNSASRLIVGGNINFSAVRDINTEIQLNTSSVVELKGNITRAGATNAKFGRFTSNSHANLVLCGSTQQTLPGNNGSGTDAFTYKGLVFNNSSLSSPQIVLDGTVTVSDSITFIKGKVFTGATDTLRFTNTAAGAVTGFNNKSYVVGYFTRAIATNSSSYDFPVGLSGEDKFYLATVKNHNMIGPSKLTAFFGTLAPVDQGILHLILPDMTVTKLNTAGMWNIEPDVQPLLGSYDISLSTVNMVGLYDNFFVGIKRPKGGLLNAFGLGNVLNGLLSSVLPGWGSPTRLVRTGYTTMSNLTSFSDFGIGESSAGSLPITLLSFTAAPAESTVKTNWVTAQEINNDYFTVERSEDGENFEQVNVVKGAGNSTITLNYDAIDEHPLMGLSYYRLKQTDFDGNFTYSDIVPVTFTNATITKSDFTIYPNPNKGSFNIKIEAADHPLKLMIINSVGQLVHMDEIANPTGKSTISLDLGSELAEGIYFVKIDTGDGMLMKQMVIQ